MVKPPVSELAVIRRLCLLCGPVLAVFVSCGIEDYYYLSPVPVGNIMLTSNTRANILLPSVSDPYFTNFAIYYRIYISERSETAEIQTSPASLNNINSTLNSDYSFFYNYTTSNTMVGTSIGSLFRNRNYYPLGINSSSSLDTVLDSGNAPGKTIVLDFQTTPATITLGSTFQLYRSNNEGAFNPRPDRLFRNSSDLHDSGYANSENNADVANLNYSTGTSSRYTYVAFYIVLVGIDLTTYSQIYSNPTFIGIMRLPD
ncbi:MAG: hypothetical protein LBS06_00190 [Treponema sp.]|jgi:hypothetical protein|nr:hypothetical protein [Treponema sp.]